MVQEKVYLSSLVVQVLQQQTFFTEWQYQTTHLYHGKARLGLNDIHTT